MVSPTIHPHFCFEQKLIGKRRKQRDNAPLATGKSDVESGYRFTRPKTVKSIRSDRLTHYLPFLFFNLMHPILDLREALPRSLPSGGLQSCNRPNIGMTRMRSSSREMHPIHDFFSSLMCTLSNSVYMPERRNSFISSARQFFFCYCLYNSI